MTNETQGRVWLITGCSTGFGPKQQFSPSPNKRRLSLNDGPSVPKNEALPWGSERCDFDYETKRARILMPTTSNLADVRDMLVVHQAFRNAYERMPGLVREVVPGDVARAIGSWG